MHTHSLLFLLTSEGIGQATAKAFAEAGCTSIALLDINVDGLETTKAMLTNIAEEARLSSIIKTYHCDVAIENSVEKAYAQVHADFARLDYCVLCAGFVVYAAGTAELPVEFFDKQIAVNLRGVFLCSQAALKIMKNQIVDCEAYPAAGIPEHRAQRGSIVSIASVLGTVSLPMSPAYCAAKAAVISLTRSNGLDYAADRIRVNTVSPGLILTPMSTPNPEVKAWLQESYVDKKIPMKRFGQPEEIADVVLFLASNRASFATGISWPVDGGALTS